MRKIKTYALGALFLSLPMLMNGQDTSDKYSFHSHGFFQGQGGLHLPFTGGNRSSLMQPNFGVGIGAWFSPVLGARINAEGLKSKVLYDGKYQSFNYFTIGLDAMLNLSPFFYQNNNPKGNLYLLGGLGLTRRGNQDFASNKNKLMHNIRVGLGYEYRIAKPLSLSLECRFNNTSDEFDPYLNNKDDWHSSLLLGVAYNFVYAKNPYATPEVSRKLVSVGDNLSLYEQAQQEINKRMDVWMRRMPGESKEDFRLRTSEQNLEALRLTTTNAVYNEFADSLKTTIREKISAANYFNTKETMTLDFENGIMPRYLLPVTPDEADMLSQQYGKDYKNYPFSDIQYKLRPDDTFEVVSAQLTLPTGKKIQSGPYNQVSNFTELEGVPFLPMANLHQVIENDRRLEEIRNKVMAEMQSYTLDNTTIQVGTEPLPTTGGVDYKVKYVYQANEGFSVKNDFAPGRYEADRSVASRAMLKIITQSLADPAFAKFLQDGNELQINYTGSADSKPVRNAIAYNGRYGDIKEQVKVNGKTQTLSVTKAEGIKSNEELSLVRAKSVRDYIHTNVPAIDKMKVTENYNVEVSDNEGAEFRRVAVEMIFRDAFK